VDAKNKPLMDAASGLPIMNIPDKLKIAEMQVVNFYKYLGIPMMQTAEDTLSAIKWQTERQAADLQLKFRKSRLSEDIKMAVFFMTLRSRVAFKLLPLYAAGSISSAHVNEIENSLYSLSGLIPSG
jgi:hypothetical protein